MGTRMHGGKPRINQITYFSPVDWRWIKQRPQFLAEGMSRFFDVHVIYPYSNRRRMLQKKRKDAFPITPYFSFPMNRLFPHAKKINDACSKWQIKRIIKIALPDCIWLTMPWQIDLLPPDMDIPIVYDCMDDYRAIDAQQDKKLIDQEKRCVKRAEVIFVSSENLQKKMEERYEEREKIYLLRNGYSNAWRAIQPAPIKQHETLKVGYFGTIGRWFDFDLLKKCVDQISTVEFHLYGPIEKGTIALEYERIYFHGVIEHDQIPQEAQTLDVLMMPFQLCEIVQSVDPVKLYEYVRLNRNIVCTQYPEIDRFEPFVYFYHSSDEFQSILAQLTKDNTCKYTPMQADAFLRENSWEKRAEQVAHILNSL